MKGIVFNVLENFISENFDEESWEKSVEMAKLEDEVFVPTKIYEDQKLLDIFTSIVTIKKLVAEDALILFGEFLFNTLANKYADLLVEFDNPKDFLKGLDSIIHVEVKKMMMGSTPPQFITVAEGDNNLVLEYRSKRKLCVLAKGLINGLNKKFGGNFTYIHTSCVHEGDDACLFEFIFD